jgi:hypothetical protein
MRPARILPGRSDARLLVIGLAGPVLFAKKAEEGERDNHQRMEIGPKELREFCAGLSAPDRRGKTMATRATPPHGGVSLRGGGQCGAHQIVVGVLRPHPAVEDSPARTPQPQSVTLGDWRTRAV